MQSSFKSEHSLNKNKNAVIDHMKNAESDIAAYNMWCQLKMDKTEYFKFKHPDSREYSMHKTKYLI